MSSRLFDLKHLQPEVDYQALMALMPEHSHPRRKLKELQTKGFLIRLKKGFYVFDPDFFGRPYSPYIVANLLYGPSYISMESALSIYQLIPERVEAITSVTTQKNKIFETPIGLFTYHHLSPTLYPEGFTSLQTADNRNYLVATPEKALLDLFCLKFKNSSKPNKRDVRLALEEDLRINMAELAKVTKKENLKSLSVHYKNRAWCRQLIQFLMESL